ncbi:hypothetical protein [Flavobacterium rhizosphaerae]|uniref:Uncharacterized protein n=1 Tax=Flavobacterium rhizosphaerae TaxID=3163298 RepID=A0ABW8YZC2_9FLAO
MQGFFLYNATGVKLQKKVTDGTGNVTTTQYSGGFIYENGVLKSMFQPEGYVDFENGISYIYQYKDHLGNVRLSYKKNSNNN